MEKKTSKSDRDLAKALREYLNDIQSEDARTLGPTWGAGGQYDMLADTGVWVGDEVQRFTGRATSAPSVVLHYDGAGYDYLSYNTPIRRYRAEIIALASRLGYGMEDLNCWSSGFYTLS